MGFPRELMNSMEPQDYLNLIVNIWEKVKLVFEPIDVFMVPRNPIDRTRLLMLLFVQPRSTHRLIQLCDARPLLLMLLLGQLRSKHRLVQN